MVKRSEEDFSFMMQHIESNSDIDIYVDKSMETADRIHSILKRRNITQKQFAKKLGKSESEISKWLSGTHNFTYKTLSKIEFALGEEIIMIIDGESHKNILNEYQVKFIDAYNKNSRVLIGFKNGYYPKISKALCANYYNAAVSQSSHCFEEIELTKVKVDLNVSSVK